MSERLIDPNNHAPEVSPSDDWDDTDGFSAHSASGATTLPPRRPPSEQASPTAVENLWSGVRIEHKLTRIEGEEITASLQIQEISGEVVRLELAAPSPHRVPRQAVSHERPPEEESQLHQLRGEGHDWGFAKKFSLYWVLGISTGIGAVIIVCLMLLPRINKPNASRPGQTAHGMTVVETNVTIEGMDALDSLLKMQPEAELVYRTYAKATIVDEVMPLVDNGDALKEIIRKDWKPMHIASAWTPPDTTSWQVLKSGSQTYGLLEGTLPNYQKFAAYFTQKGNQLLLDWKATTAYGTASFDDLEHRRGDTREIRGQIAPATFYTKSWPEKEYQSYRLLPPSGDASVWCYARRKEPAGEACAALFKKGEILNKSKVSQKVTLRLEHGPDDAQPNQWLVRDLLHIDWITPLE